jgi:hypothetical protein
MKVVSVSFSSSVVVVVVLTLLSSFADEAAANANAKDAVDDETATTNSMHRLRTDARRNRRRATGNAHLSSLINIDKLESSSSSSSKNDAADITGAFDEELNGGVGMIYLDRMLQSSMSMSMRMLGQDLKQDSKQDSKQMNNDIVDAAATSAFVEEEADTIYVERMLQSMSMSM